MAAFAGFTPTVYMKRGCSFCTKVAIFLADIGATGIEWKFDTEENRALVIEKCGKASFPCYQFGPDEYMLESDDIMAKIAEEKNVDIASLNIFQYCCNPDSSMFATFFKMMRYGVKKEGGFPQFFKALASTSQPELKILYWDIDGRAAPLRLACVLGGLQFENSFATFEEFRAMKEAGELKYGQFPVLYVDGVQFAQSNSQLRYLGKLGGLYPENPLEALKVDEVLDFLTEIGETLSLAMHPTRAGFDSFASEEKKLEVRARIASDILPPKLSKLNSILEANGTGFLVGEKPTIADCSLRCSLRWLSKGILDGIPPFRAGALPPVPGVRGSV